MPDLPVPGHIYTGVGIVCSLNMRRAVAATSFPLTIMISALLSTIPVTG